MKLAEALLLRGDIQKKLAQLRERIMRYAVVQEGEKPAEDPNKLLKEAVGVLDELEALVFSINQANLRHKLKDERTLTEAMAHRDALAQHHALLQAAIAGTNKEPDRYGLKEIRWVKTVDVAKLQKQSDDLAKKLRETNGMIQEMNWKVEIPD
jgi:hypothetical protein